ncbi:MAG: tetratricopeptide repeat protein [bacterium]
MKKTEGVLKKHNLAEVHTKIAEIYFYSGDYAKSIQFCEKAIEIKPKNGRLKYHLAYFVKGHAHLKNEEYREALDSFEKALDCLKNYHYYYWAGYICEKIGDMTVKNNEEQDNKQKLSSYQEALKYYQGYQEKFKNRPFIYHNFVTSLLSEEDQEEVMNDNKESTLLGSIYRYFVAGFKKKPKSEEPKPEEPKSEKPKLSPAERVNKKLKKYRVTNIMRAVVVFFALIVIILAAFIFRDFWGIKKLLNIVF